QRQEVVLCLLTDRYLGNRQGLVRLAEGTKAGRGDRAYGLALVAVPPLERQEGGQDVLAQLARLAAGQDALSGCSGRGQGDAVGGHPRRRLVPVGGLRLLLQVEPVEGIGRQRQ